MAAPGQGHLVSDAPSPGVLSPLRGRGRVQLKAKAGPHPHATGASAAPEGRNRDGAAGGPWVQLGIAAAPPGTRRGGQPAPASTRAVRCLPYRKPSFRNCSCRMSLYSSKPPSMRVTVAFSHTQSSWHSRRMKRSSWDTRITPPWDGEKGLEPGAPGAAHLDAVFMSWQRSGGHGVSASPGLEQQTRRVTKSGGKARRPALRLTETAGHSMQRPVGCSQSKAASRAGASSLRELKEGGGTQSSFVWDKTVRTRPKADTPTCSSMAQNALLCSRVQGAEIIKGGSKEPSGFPPLLPQRLWVMPAAKAGACDCATAMFLRRGPCPSIPGQTAGVWGGVVFAFFCSKGCDLFLGSLGYFNTPCNSRALATMVSGGGAKLGGCDRVARVISVAGGTRICTGRVRWS